MDPLAASTRTTDFPPDAAAWLAGQSGRTVVLVGHVPTGRPLASALAALGYDVRASSDGTMSLPDRSVDAVIGVDVLPDLETAARVLRPGGQVAVLDLGHDERIPWVRKLRAAIGVTGADGAAAGAADALAASEYYGAPGGETFRYWQVVARDSLAEVVEGLSAVQRRSSEEQRRAVHDAQALYDDYGRGPDGMQLPWIAQATRAPVLAEAWAMVTEQARRAAEAAERAEQAARDQAAREQAARDQAEAAEIEAAELEAAAREAAAPDGAFDAAPADAAPADASVGDADVDDEAPAPAPRRDPVSEETVPLAVRPSRPRPPAEPTAFELGDTAAGVITYVVDTGEMPALTEDGVPVAAAPPAPSSPAPSGPAPSGPAPSAAEDDGDDGLLFRFS